MGGAVTVDKTLQWYPLHVYTGIAEALLQCLALSAYGHNVAWTDSQEVVGVVHLVVHVDGDNLVATAADVLHEWLVLLPQRVLLGAGLPGPDVARAVLRIARISLQSTANHCAQVAIYDVEVCVKVHLHLP